MISGHWHKIKRLKEGRTVLEIRVKLIKERFTPNTFTTFTCPAGVTTLDHETLNASMKETPIVVVRCSQGQKIKCRFWYKITKYSTEQQSQVMNEAFATQHDEQAYSSLILPWFVTKVTDIFDRQTFPPFH